VTAKLLAVRALLFGALAVALATGGASCRPQTPKQDPRWRSTPSSTTPAESGNVPTFPPVIQP
jgi:hypothetical protein